MKRLHHKLRSWAAVLMTAGLCALLGTGLWAGDSAAGEQEAASYIKWAEFRVPFGALERALNADVKSQDGSVKIDWVDVLSFLAAKYFGVWKRYKAADLDRLVIKLKEGIPAQELAKDLKYYDFYRESYQAVLGGFVGRYKIEVKNKEGEVQWVTKYGLKAFSPIAKGFGYSHYDDFGDSRTFGYRRTHLGNDLIGSIGTPVIAVESGTVEMIGWNMYGGWRLGIRSLDGKRSYYYAHLRKNRPYAQGIVLGQTVTAGDVIGYLGMTGYSIKENVNNITTPHLHFGMQLVFDESQKEGINQIWIDVYNLVRLLQKNRSAVTKNIETKEYLRTYALEEITQGGEEQ